MPKTFSIGGGCVGKIQKIVVPAHQVAHSRGDRQIYIRRIFGIPVELEDARDLGNDRGSLFECRKESIDDLVCQCGKPLSNSGTCQHVANFGHDFLGHTELDRIQFHQEKARTRGALASGSALKKHHAVEYGADLWTIRAHRLDADFAPDNFPHGLRRRGGLAPRHWFRCRLLGHGKGQECRLRKLHHSRPWKGPRECRLPAEVRQSGLSRPQAAGVLQKW